MDDKERLRIGLVKENTSLLTALIEANYPSRLSRELKMNRRTVHRHLNLLQTAGLVKRITKQQTDDMPMARMYKLTEKGEQILKHIQSIK
jgi:DNA-binding MarR family transcriptional regulator